MAWHSYTVSNCTGENVVQTHLNDNIKMTIIQQDNTRAKFFHVCNDATQTHAHKTLLHHYICTLNEGTAAAAPPPLRPGNPALWGSRPLVTPYNCRLGDLLCVFVYAVFVCYFVCVCICVICVFWGCFPLQPSPSVLWYCWLGLLTCKNRLPYNLYCVGGDVKHCTIQSILYTQTEYRQSDQKDPHCSITQTQYKCRATASLHRSAWTTPWNPLLPYWYSYKALSVECPDVKIYKCRFNPVWHRMLYSCTHMANWWQWASEG